ncbi:hypothetical protein FG386_001601 [Cryptosporidium ryanae]|uniref:uncharacterized protein n=1 Tax=Cryptosporidium ryanae TaxID=515981 RepID=UPI00351A96F1|nr:hypothetical protein FG386_001601 [Cryptosporidium ryanae]
MSRSEKSIHIVQSGLDINWKLIEKDIFSKPKRIEFIGKHIKYLCNPISISEDVVHNLSKVFARLVSIELQLFNLSNSFGGLGLFVLNNFGTIQNVDIYSNSKLIFDKIVNSYIDLKSSLKQEKASHQVNNNIFLTGFIDGIEKIVNKLEYISKNITIWILIPEVDFFSNNLILLSILECLVNSLHYELQKKFINAKDLKINLIFILEYPSDDNTDKKCNEPIITTKQGISNIKITFINSKSLLSYSDVVISQVFETILLRVDLSNVNTFNEFKYITLFTLKNDHLLKFIKKRSFKLENNKKHNNSEQSEFSNSEEGGVLYEYENIVSITSSEFSSSPFDELIDIIQLKILGKIPNQFNPTAIEIFPLSSPVGRNPINVISSIRNSLEYESILLGKEGIPNFALIPSMRLISNNSKVLDVNMYKIEKRINAHTEFIETSLVRTPFNLSIINRDPIIPFPVSRAFNYEEKIKSTSHIECSGIESNTYSFQSECFEKLFMKMKDEIKLNIYIDCNQLQKQSTGVKNSSFNQTEHTFRKSLLNLKEKKEISEKISTIFSSIPSLFTELNQELANEYKSRFESDDSDLFKFENFGQEKNYLEHKFKIKSVKVIDILFTEKKWGYDNRLLLESFFVSFPFRSSEKPNKGSNINTGLIIDNIELFFQKILCKIHLIQNLSHDIEISNQDINYIIENRGYVKKHSPKIFWLSLNIFVHSLKSVSKEYCRIFYILNNRNFELQNNILLPKLNLNSNKVINMFSSSELFHTKNIYLNYNAISFTNVLQIGDAKILENKKLNYE